MTKYKGFYIDGVTFSSRADIDSHIKSDMIKRFRTFTKMFINYTDPSMMMAASAEAARVAHELMSTYGVTGAELEAIEIEIITAES